MTPPETEYALAPDGVHIAYQVTGSGDVDLVLMHGTVSHLEIAWDDPKLRRLYERLGEFTRLIRFDRRGMGMSDPLDAMPVFDEQLEDFATVMEATGSDRAAVMGTTDAGVLALSFAAAHPDRVSGVVAFETSPRLMPSADDDFGVDLEMLQRMSQASAAIDLDQHLSIVAPARMNEPGFRSWFRRYNRSASSGFRIDTFIRSQMSWDIRDRLSDVKAPVLVLHRTENTILPMRNARALAAVLPDARLAEIEGTGTAIFADDVEDIADQIEGFLTGTRPPPRHDRVLATVLFTDIVGSTERASELGDREWRDLLERHHRLLRAELDRFGGHEVHTAGDGFLATFDSPRRAIECARAAALAIRSIGLDIRAGAHTGEVELSDGEVQGLAVHIGARISGLAGRGEVLVSSTVKDIVIGSGIEFHDRGEHVLKGVPGSWHVYAVA
ncbi:MAG TPA: adenylate/guanylate cyclase domain-containing protein [Actinomycetota bacterium]|nr:adenylate/guanylate cyclase domain-containing protein [Actinomycetota bacterium]